MDKIIPIEGGLGAQILTYIIINHFLKVGTPVKVDLRYFQNIPKIAERGNGLSFFKWELDYFGIDINSIKNHDQISLLDRIAKNLPLKTHVKDGEPYKLKCLAESLKNDDWKSLFPIQKDDAVKAQEIIGDNGHIVVHIRKGDFLNVASHVTTEEMVIPLLSKFKGCGVGKLIIITDGNIEVDRFKAELGFIKDISTYQNINNMLSHAIMRKAAILITSNSQFSLTAGLLNESGLVISPKKWFGNSKKNAELEKLLGKIGSWNLI
jgi:hypothetical protein